MAYKNSHIEGDLTVGHNETVGGTLNVNGKATFKGGIDIEGFLECEFIKDWNKGFFANSDDLVAAYPNPQPGWVAFVQANGQYLLYRENSGGWLPTLTDASQFIQIVGDINDYTQKIEELRAEVAENQSSLSSFTTKIAEVESTVDEAWTKANNLEIDVSAIKAENNAQEIASLKSTTSNIQSTLNTVSTKVGALESSVSTQNGKIKTLEEASAQTSTTLNALTKNVSAIKAENNAQEVKISELESKIKIRYAESITGLKTITNNGKTLQVPVENGTIATTRITDGISQSLSDVEFNLNELDRHVEEQLEAINADQSNLHDLHDQEVADRKSAITSLSSEVNQSLLSEAQERMAADSSLGNRITTLSNTVELNKLFTDTAIDSVDNRLTQSMGTPKVDGIEEGNKELAMGSTNTGYTVVFLSTLKCFAAKTDTGYFPNWGSYSSYPSAVAYGIQDMNNHNGAPSPIVGRMYSIDDELYTWDGNNFTIQCKVDEKITNAIAEVIANAPEDLDTLKEVADYIASDKTKASEIEVAISDLKKANNTLAENLTKNTTDISKNTSDITVNTTNIGILSKKVIESVDVSELDELVVIPMSANGKADYWLTQTSGGFTTIIGRVFLFEDNLKHKVTQVVMSNQRLDDNFPVGSHTDEGLTVCYRFYGHTGNDVPLKQWAPWKKLYDSEDMSPDEIETAISNLQKKEKEYGEVIAHNTGAIANNMQAIDLLAEELETKAPKEGYAPDLKVDFAKELVGRGVAEPQEIGVIRPTGEISIGDGNATIEKVKGKSVVWNQLYKAGYYSTSNDTFTQFSEKTINGVTFSLQNDGAIKVNGTASANAFLILTMGKQRAGRKFLLKGCPQGGSASTYGIAYGALWLGYADVGNGSIISTNTTGYQFSIFVKTGVTVDNIIFRPQFSDLTQMFGAGNEPSTIEEFEARKPFGIDEYAYNEGEIISYDANELKSVGFNAFNGTYAKVIGGQQYHALGTITSIGFTTELGGETTEVTLDSEGMFTPSETGYVYAEGSDICIHLTHTYTPEHTTEYEEDILTLPDVKSIKDKDGNPLFPYGLLSAGSVHDEITATKAVKRIGVVDLGTISFYINSAGPRFIGPISTIKQSNGFNNVGWLNATKYNVGSVGGGSPEGTIGILNRNIYVKDNTFTNPESLKDSLLGIPLYYELESPIEVDLPEPLNLTYKAWDFGTEELIADGKTTPLNADIVYQFNAVDRIRENTTNVSEIEEEVATKQQELTLTVLDNGNIRIGNLQGQTKDFMPATPSGDPMHYAYESMGAEYNSSGVDKTKTGMFGDTIVHKAGYWYLNELGGLTNSDIRNVYNEGEFSRNTKYLENRWAGYNRMTNMSFSGTDGGSFNASYMFYSTACETIMVGAKGKIAYVGSGRSMFQNAACKKILNTLNLSFFSNAQDMFTNARALEYVDINNLKLSLSLATSQNLKNISILNMIKNANASATITITLHADAYARAMADADITTALASKTYVTLASA